MKIINRELQLILIIRAFAISLIIIDHLLLSHHTYTPESFPFTFFRDGINGVFIIFICESYLLTKYILHKDINKSLINCCLLIIKRILVVFPAIYIYLFFVYFSNIFQLQIEEHNFYSALSYAFNYIDKPHPVVYGHLWAIWTEETFFLFLTPIIFYFHRKKSIYLLSLIAISSIIARVLTFYFYLDPGVFNWPIYIETHLNLFGLCFGSLIALNEKRSELNFLFSRFKAHWICLVLLLIISPYFETIFGFQYQWLYKPILSCICLAILFNYVINYKYSLTLQSKSLIYFQWFGKIYFSVYIWQQLFIFNIYKKAPLLENLILSIIISLLVGTISFIIIELNARKFSVFIDNMIKK